MALTEHTEKHLSAHHRDFKAFAEAMVASHAGRFDETFWGFMRQHAPTSVRLVVDVGTGPGLLLRDLRGRFQEARVVGVDGQPEMLTKARELVRETPGTHVIAHDVSAGRTPELDDASVDVVVASMVFHELPVPTTLLDEAARLLRPGGLLLLSDWVRQPLAHYANQERPSDIDAFTHFSEHCRYTPDDVAWLVEKSGFRVAEWMARKNGRFVLLAAHRLDASESEPRS